MTILACSSGAIVTGFILDALFGDPHGFPHTVRFMGKLIAALENSLRRLLPVTEQGEKLGGVILVFIVTGICTGVPLAILLLCYRIFLPLGYMAESLLCYQLLAARSLKTESMQVYYSLRNNDMDGARKNLSMIVGRDTKILGKSGIIRGAVETVAENTSDGVIAPLFYMMFGGAVLGCLYKSVNTMDSMVGYKNEKYLHFGWFAAKTDDVFNYIPSRLSGVLMVLSAYLLPFDGKSACRVWRRDRRKHASPNAAQTEAACAGALGIQLAGPALYHGILYDKPYIGDNARPVQGGDIVNANRLMYAAAVIALAMAIMIRALCLGVLFFGSI